MPHYCDMRSPKSNGRREAAVAVYTRREAEALADRKAQAILGASSREEAFRRLDAGELAGTAAEAEFSNLRWLLTGS